jgi:Ni/Fe-hydrogenase subunit HybB-like protein
MSANPREASLRPFGKPGVGWWLLVGVLGSVVGVGLVAWVIQLRDGMGVAGYNDHAFWAIYIADVITFIGVSYGGAVVSAILRLTGATWRAPLTRLAEGTAVCTVLVGGALIIPHIGRPERLYELATHPNFSAPVFWDFIAVTTYTTASIVFFALPLVPDMAILHSAHAKRLGRARTRLYAMVSRGWVGAPRQRRILSGALGLVSILIIPLAVSVHSVLAWAFATTSRPWWHESIWAPQFVVAALYSGVALVILVVAGFRRGYHLESFISPRHFVRLGFIMATLGAAYLYLTFADILPGAYVGETSTSTVFGELLVGRLAGWFWLFIIAGGVIPLLLIALPWTRNVTGMVVAACFIVPMMWLKRLLMVIAPANFDVVTGTSGDYHFTWIPIAITLAALAAVPLMLMLLFRVVPLLSIDEIEEIDEHEELKNAAAADAYLRAAAPVAVEHKAAEHDEALVGAGTRRSGALVGSASRKSGALLLLLVLACLGAFGIHAAAPASAATAPASATKALAAAADAPSGPTLTMSGVDAHGTVTLTAKVTEPGGAPVTSGKVTFELSSSVFGVRQVPLASVPLGKTGAAHLALDGKHSNGYRPTRVGPQEFTASYAANVGDEPVRFSTNVNITTATSAFLPAPPKPLEGAGRALVKALALIVLTVWLLLITQVVRVMRACRRMPKAAMSSA